MLSWDQASEISKKNIITYIQEKNIWALTAQHNNALQPVLFLTLIISCKCWRANNTIWHPTAR
jgi:hypothetical protein